MKNLKVLCLLFVLSFLFSSAIFSQHGDPVFSQTTIDLPIQLVSPDFYSQSVNTDSQFINVASLNPAMYSNLFEIQPNIIPLGGYLGWPISIMDFNMDGKLDFFGNWFTDSTTTGYVKSAMAEKDDNLDLYKISYFFPDTSVEYIKSYDINSDGNADFLVSAIDSGRYYSLRCYTNNPLSSYPDSLLFKQFILPGVVVKPAIGDFDGDNLIDFVIMNNFNVPGINELCVAFYELDTISEKFALRQTINISNEYREFAIADFDGDNLIEFFTGTTNGNVIGIKNVANNRYELFLFDYLDTPNLYVSRYAGDLDNDGNKDIIMIGTTWGYSQIYWLNYSDKHVKVRRKIVLAGTDIFSNVHLSLSDVDNDQNEELILNLGFSLLILKWSEANKEFEVFYYMKTILGEYIDCVEVYDFENDSTPDLFISVSRVQQPSFITYYYKNKFLLLSVNETENINNFSLSQNYPNPFNPSTKISYSIAAAGIVSLKIYDILGREVSTLVNEEKPVGRYEVNFNASQLASGVYFYQIKAGDFVQTKKLMLLK